MHHHTPQRIKGASIKAGGDKNDVWFETVKRWRYDAIEGAFVGAHATSGRQGNIYGKAFAVA